MYTSPGFVKCSVFWLLAFLHGYVQDIFPILYIVQYTCIVMWKWCVKHNKIIPFAFYSVVVATGYRICTQQLNKTFLNWERVWMQNYVVHKAREQRTLLLVQQGVIWTHVALLFAVAYIPHLLKPILCTTKPHCTLLPCFCTNQS